ncbi:response regulator transcription factor [Solicola sp. PLA-1-18]|uniref:response regulator transcription factor n=1 Tax=Solicola sp. PLA-1-18 TaxID=3380532 RepID=UPI003B79A181
MTHVLLVEDDDAIRTALTRGLGELGSSVTAVPSGAEAIAAAVDQRPDIVVLDLGLPDIDGADVLKMLRAISDVPVIIATARDDEREVVRLLDAGADDYVIKPFSAAQVEARVRAVLRRSGATSKRGAHVEVGRLRIDRSARQARLDGTDLKLSRKEFDLLLALAENVGTVMSKRDLLAQVWQMPWGGADRTVDVHLSWLRRKLGETAQEPVYLHSLRGVGVKMVDPTAAAGS